MTAEEEGKAVLRRAKKAFDESQRAITSAAA